jgi:hypothetical protein
MSTLSPKQWFKFTVCTVVVVYLLSTFNLLDSDQHKYYQDDSTSASAMMLMHFSPVDYDYVTPPTPPESFLIPENRSNQTLTGLTGTSLDTSDNDSDNNTGECRITSQVRVILSKPFWTMLALDQHGNIFREGGDDFHVTFTESSSSSSSSPISSFKSPEPEIAVAFVSDLENGSYRLEFVGTSPSQLPANSITSTLLPANQSETILTTSAGTTGILTVQILNKWRCSSRNHQQFLAIDQLLRHDSQKQQRQRAASAHPTILTYTKQDVPMPPILGL